MKQRGLEWHPKISDSQSSERAEGLGQKDARQLVNEVNGEVSRVNAVHDENFILRTKFI